MPRKPLSKQMLAALKGAYREPPENMQGVHNSVSASRKPVHNLEESEDTIMHGDPGLRKWPATPRYLLAEMERFGHRREDVRGIIWAAWVNSTSTDVDRVVA